MKRTLLVSVALVFFGAYVDRPAQGDHKANEPQTYVRLFYCFDSKSVLDQKQAGKQRIVVGYSLPSVDPFSEDMKACAKSGGTMMMGYTQISPPFIKIDDDAAAHD